MTRELSPSSSSVGQDDLTASIHSRRQSSLSPNNARAIRIAELMNDYRTLLFHIMELTASFPSGGALQEGHLVLIRGRAAALTLSRTSYKLSAATDHGWDEDAQTSKLKE